VRARFTLRNDKRQSGRSFRFAMTTTVLLELFLGFLTASVALWMLRINQNASAQR
jgi:hypothetical protein